MTRLTFLSMAQAYGSSPFESKQVFAGAWRAGGSSPSSKPITEQNATCDGVSRFVGCTRLAGG